MRIIGGKYKGRRFTPPGNLPVRPTTDFAREALFNILRHQHSPDGMAVMDLFSGTGSLALECASAGAGPIWCVDNNRNCCKFIQQTFDTIGEEVNVISDDVFRFLKSRRMTFDLILADPPYEHPALDTIPGLIFEHEWLKPDGWLVLEHPGTYQFNDHPRFKQHRKYGSVNFSIFSNQP